MLDNIIRLREVSKAVKASVILPRKNCEPILRNFKKVLVFEEWFGNGLCGSNQAFDFGRDQQMQSGSIPFFVKDSKASFVG